MSQTKNKNAVYVVSSMLIISLIGKVLGLIRDVITGAALGATGAGAAFNLATAIPRNFLDIAFASAISGCFIPVFNSTLALKGKKEAVKLANTFITVVLLIAFIVTASAVILRQPLVMLLGPGMPAETQELTAQLFIITLPIIIFAAAAFSLTGILQSFGEFNIPAAMSIVSNGCIIIYCIFFSERFGVYGLALVFLLGWGLQTLIQIPPLIKEGFRFLPSFDIKNPALLEIRALVLPVMISTWVLPVNDMVNLSISTRVSESASVAYSRANVLYSVITGVFVLSVANYIFPLLTRQKAGADETAFADTLRGAIRGLVFFLVPMAVGLFIFALPLADLVFRFGLFDTAAVELTAKALRFFCFGMLFFGLQTIFSRAFYARKNAVIPLVTSITAVIINAVLSFILKEYLGVGGPALASSIAFTAAAFIMVSSMYRINKDIINTRVFTDLVKVTASSAVMGVVSWALYNNIDFIGQGKLFDVIRLLAAVIAGVVIYFLCTYVLSVEEAKTAGRMVKKILSFKRF